MSKLFNLKEWLTVPEAARHLGIVFGEEVTEADVLRLALDGHLQLSFYFVNHAKARRGTLVAWEDTDWVLFPDIHRPKSEQSTKCSDEFAVLGSKTNPRKLQALLDEIPLSERKNYKPLMLSKAVGDGRFFTLEDRVTRLAGVWDLPMIGSEKIDIENRYQALTGGPAVNLHCLDGCFVEGDRQICQLQERYEEDTEFALGSTANLEILLKRIAEEHLEKEEAASLLNRHKEDRKKLLERADSERYFPAGGLPNDGVVVVRTASLRNFEQTMSKAQDPLEKPLGTTERAVLLTIISLLADEAKIDWRKPSKAASLILASAEKAGFSLGQRTVEEHFKKIPDALERRGNTES